MSLAVAVRHRLGAFTLDAGFASQGRLTAIFGPSGSGKTSLVNAIAGLLRPDFGKIAVDGAVLTDTDRGIAVPVHRRSIGYVFQDARLFPHLSVTQNLRYGRWFTPAAQRYADMAKIVELLDIGHLLDRRPHRLSGGERQRVALGRALLRSPRLLLMDEPLASLDRARTLEIMPYVERLRDEMRIPIVYVSHSLAEVSRLATDIVVMAQGRVTAAGPAETIIQGPAFAAGEERHEASSLLAMTVAAYDEEFDLTTLRSTAGEAKVPGRVAAIGTSVRLGIRARDVIVATEQPHGLSALNIFSGTIAAIGDGDGASRDVRIAAGDAIILARVTRQSCAALGLAQGMRVQAIVKSLSVETPGPAPAPNLLC